ncbi:MAG TPA: glycine--tRNA ligase subunit beta [Terriglobia bacterium]|jgi:glycyl-tRNA synthetase beta chain|nr:glycine--tRNA ligase subunit beta [Terriglobia bacterium]
MSDATLPLLVEIGCAEIPARFLTDAEKQFGERLLAALGVARLLEPRSELESPVAQGGNPESLRPDPTTTYSTPRRLVAHVPALLSRQPDLEEQVTGPAVKVAFDAAGKPTRAAESFAARNGVKIEELLKVETPKGLYIGAKRATPGRPAADVLAELLPQVIRSMTFPKSMVWEATGVRFVRPIRWILALLGEDGSGRAIEFELAGVKSGNHTSGHRSAGSDPIPVESFADYAQKLRRHFVEFDPESRRQSVRSEVNVVLEPWQDAVADPDLEEWVVNSTEWLAGLRGGFDERYLALPREILVTVMRDHQKYFAVEDREGRLLPHFVTLLNRDRDSTGVIRAGHERVLTARFSDAEFFWKADQKIPLRDRPALLERVTYQAKLGSYTDKVRRMRAIAEYICVELEGRGNLSPEQRSHAFRALDLCKCDLTTQMVQEFTELQGVVGGLYAQAQGEPEEVAQAIYDHYKPVNHDDGCPRSVVGAIVSLADKLDAVVAGFSVGLEPTGSSDPFGLRRAGNGIVKLAAESLPSLDLYNLATQTVEIERLHLPGPSEASLWAKVDQFFRERLAFYLGTVAALSYDTVRAVLNPNLARDWNRPADALARGQALDRVRGSEDFQALAAAAKRTRNILTKSAKAEDFRGVDEVKPELFKAPEERGLYAAYEAARAELDETTANPDYAAILHLLAKLRPAVDQFFDKVMVMDSDPAVRANRLRLLTELDSFAFRRFADLSEIESAAPSDDS